MQHHRYCGSIFVNNRFWENPATVLQVAGFVFLPSSRPPLRITGVIFSRKGSTNNFEITGCRVLPQLS